MSKALVIEFTKMHGAGNDFIMIDNRFLYLSQSELSALAKKYCPRKTSLGADGLIALSNPKSEETDFLMEYYNSDGSRGEMCGNGARCLARFAFDSGIQKDELVFLSDVGIVSAFLIQLDPSIVQILLPSSDSQIRKLTLGEESGHNFRSSYFLNSGVPHVVGFVADLDRELVERVGSIIRRDKQFSQGTNVNFVQETNASDRFRVRTFERGVEAETLACGTGAIAVAKVVRSISTQKLSEVTIEMPGGELTVSLPENEKEKGPIKLTGPTFKVCRGSLEL